MKEEINAEMKALEACVLVEVEYVKGIIDHLHSSAYFFVIDPLVVNLNPTGVSSDPTDVVPHTDLAVDLP